MLSKIERVENIRMSYELDFLPVGENAKSGDAILFRFWDDAKGETEKDQKVCLIDGGYAKDGEKIKQHMDKYYHTDVIDLVISTHPDLDHIGGLSYILENMDVKKLWLHRPWKDNIVDGLSDCFKDGRITDNSIKNDLKEGLSKAYELEQLANSKKIPIEDPYTDVSEFNGIITVLSPTEEYYRQLLAEFRCTPEPAGKEIKESIITKAKNVIIKIFETWTTDKLEKEPITTAENNSSTVLLLKINSSEYILLTSDAGVLPLQMASEILSTMGIKENVVYYQIPHHGSKHNVNSSLLDNLIGKIVDKDATIKKGACISVAKESDYKHPSQAVINAFVRRGIKPVLTKGKNLCKHSNDIPNRKGYTTAKQLEFCANYEVEG